MRAMNSRPQAAYVDRSQELDGIEYRRGDFIVHFYHTKDPILRLFGMKKYYDEWMRIEPHTGWGEITDEIESFDRGYKWEARRSFK